MCEKAYIFLVLRDRLVDSGRGLIELCGMEFGLLCFLYLVPEVDHMTSHDHEWR